MSLLLLFRGDSGGGGGGPGADERGFWGRLIRKFLPLKQITQHLVIQPRVGPFLVE
jgi:hypothetical protein